jgi:CBS-domain-containing membrane protein
MNSAIERLLTLRVSDVMNRRVVHLSSQATLAEAARTFRDKSISGAPVVDPQQHCVGVLSATDFVKRHVGVATREGEELVSHYMSTTVQGIAPERSLLDAARLMCDEHIHRLPVLDPKGHLLGMLTSLDVVAALVHAVEE